MSDFETDLLEGLAGLLNTAGAGVYKSTGTYASTDTAIVFGDLPGSPDRCIALNVYASSDALEENLSTVRVQAMLRGDVNNPLDVGALSVAVFSALHGLTHQDVGSSHAAMIRRISTVHMGRDTDDRMRRSDNYEVLLNTPATAGRP